MFAAGVASRAFFVLDLSKRLSEQLRAAYLARGAVEYATVVLGHDADPSVDALNERWADDESSFHDHPLAGGTFTIIAGDEDGVTRYGLSDEERRIPLNSAPTEVLEQLLETTGGMRVEDAQEAAAAIEDWRDPDTNQRPRGAEGFYYHSLGQAYDCKDGPFENVEELLLVKGIEPEIYRRIEPYVTVFGSGRVNMNTASLPVIRAFGVSDVGVDGVRYFRAGNDNTPRTSDDRRLVSVGELESELKAYVSVEDLAQLKHLIQEQFLTTGSTVFRMAIEAQMETPMSRMQAFCVIDRQGSIKQWTLR
jgi:general secretion pathway protein K